MKKKTITVFGSSLPVEGDDEFKFAYELGKQLAKNNFNLCTGGYRGIMHAVSKGANEGGGEAIGITVDLWGVKPSEYLTSEIFCKTLPERIEKLIGKGDGYVILQGGTGALLELAFVWEMLNKKLMERKPVVCHSNMWKEIVSVMEKQIEKEGRITGLIKNFESVEEIVKYLLMQLN
ncbi:MAG TPA: LOG family protein [Ignavibacteriaceae bacterium]|nr:LOG family protein [Ignavibacteriaceae bacterium]